MTTDDDRCPFGERFDDNPSALERDASFAPTLTELLLIDIAHSVGPHVVRQLVTTAEAERKAGNQGASLSDEDARWTLSVGEEGVSVYFHGFGPYLLSEAGVEVVLEHMEEEGKG